MTKIAFLSIFFLTFMWAGITIKPRAVYAVKYTTIPDKDDETAKQSTSDDNQEPIENEQAPKCSDAELKQILNYENAFKTYRLKMAPLEQDMMSNDFVKGIMHFLFESSSDTSSMSLTEYTKKNPPTEQDMKKMKDLEKKAKLLDDIRMQFEENPEHIKTKALYKKCGMATPERRLNKPFWQP